MGVHNKAAYAAVKRELAIPPEEPIFILRAQDVHSIVVLELYRNIVAGRPGGDQAFVVDVQKVVDEFYHYQGMHPDRVKEPD